MNTPDSATPVATTPERQGDMLHRFISTLKPHIMDQGNSTALRRLRLAHEFLIAGLEETGLSKDAAEQALKEAVRSHVVTEEGLQEFARTDKILTDTQKAEIIDGKMRPYMSLLAKVATNAE